MITRPKTKGLAIWIEPNARPPSRPTKSARPSPACLRSDARRPTSNGSARRPIFRRSGPAARSLSPRHRDEQSASVRLEPSWLRKLRFQDPRRDRSRATHFRARARAQGAGCALARSVGRRRGLTREQILDKTAKTAIGISLGNSFWSYSPNSHPEWRRSCGRPVSRCWRSAPTARRSWRRCQPCAPSCL